MTDTRFHDVLSLPTTADVEFILVGGMAAIAMGASRATHDVDIL